MSSEVFICNLALSHIGAYRIQALTEASKEARECKTLYAHNRDAVLEDHDWNFARKSAALALSTEEFSGWDYAYAYPTDCIAPRKIQDVTGSVTGTSYDIDTGSYNQSGAVEFELAVGSDLNQRFILTDKQDAELIYTAKVVNPVMFSPQFVDALSYRLASDLATPVKGKPALKQELFQVYLLTVGGAKTSSANQKYEKPDNSSDFSKARL